MFDVTIGYMIANLDTLLAEVRYQINELDNYCIGLESRKNCKERCL